MKVEMTPKLHPRRGGEVKIGNVYNNPHGKSFYKVVVGMPTETSRGRPAYKNVICIHVNTAGEVIGCSANPDTYISEHQDLVGIVRHMPTLKIEWLDGKSLR